MYRLRLLHQVGNREITAYFPWYQSFTPDDAATICFQTPEQPSTSGYCFFLWVVVKKKVSAFLSGWFENRTVFFLTFLRCGFGLGWWWVRNIYSVYTCHISCVLNIMMRTCSRWQVTPRNTNSETCGNMVGAMGSCESRVSADISPLLTSFIIVTTLVIHITTVKL